MKMSRKALTREELLKQKMQQEPHGYKCCVKEECGCRQECLHYLFYKKNDDFFLSVINPKKIVAFGTEKCNFFADATRPTTYALGFVGFVNRLNKDEKDRFQRRCMRSFCKSVFYEMRAGNRVIMPWEQDALREAAEHEGIKVTGQFFDETFEAPAW